MKAGKEHRVPWSDAAIALLRALPRTGDSVFPGGKANHSDGGLGEILHVEGAGLAANLMRIPLVAIHCV